MLWAAGDDLWTVIAKIPDLQWIRHDLGLCYQWGIGG